MTPKLGGRLTRYTEGSVRELWAISYPLILSMLSMNVMIFFDRLILARYNMQAMNAAVISELIFSIFQYGTMGIATISEIFIGQYNGAQKSRSMGAPVWQMIWFSIITAFLFVPLGFFAKFFFISQPDYIAEGVPFLRTLLWFGPAFPLVAALSSFFTAQGCVKLVMITTIGSNILNILLDFLLIFGIGDFIPALGAKGAAIATGAAQATQAIVFLVIFLNKQHREWYGTSQWHFNSTLFWHILRIGFPRSLSDIFSAIAWIALAQILGWMSEAHITVYSVADSFFALFGFAFLGLQRGITTVSANYIGANREEVLSLTLRSGAKIVFAIMFFLAIPLFIFPDKLAELFSNYDNTLLAAEEVKNYFKMAILWLWVYFLFDAIAWLFHGILTAAGDTKFLMILNSLGPWLFAVLPVYVGVVYYEGNPVISCILQVIYSLSTAFCYFLRYKSKRWKLEQPLYATT